MKKIFALLTIATLSIGLLTGCGEKKEEPDDQQTVTEAPETNPSDEGDPNKPYAGTKLKFAMTQADNQNQERIELIKMVEEQTGIIIEPILVPEATDGAIDKVLVGLMAGDVIDIVYYAEPRLKPLYNAGVLTPLGDIASSLNYNMDAVFGDFLPVFNNEVYGLPAFSDIWLTLYNKKVFDDAGVPYPDAEGWTWEKYIETGKLLTDESKGIYGSLMLDYNNYNYMYAVQSGAEHYNREGLSNYDDPRFKEGLEFFYDLGNVHKIQPSMLEFKAGNIQWDAFFANETYGMFVCGGWTLQMMAEKENYPRDWQFGVLPMPYPEGQQPSTLTLPGCYSIPSTSTNKEAAFTAIACIAENQYKLGYGRIPARKDLSEAEINQYIENELVAPYAEDGVTVEDIKATWFDANRYAYPEKLIGAGDAEINQIWVEEGQLYGQGAKELDKAIEDIKSRSDRAIRESGEQ